jgi:hypothetical protein
MELSMKLFFAGLPLRQKELWFAVIVDLLLLAGFIVDRCCWPKSPNLASVVLIFSYMAPMLYSVLKLHTTDDTRTDERDKAIEGRGRDAGYVLLSGGILFVLIGDPPLWGLSWATGLLIVWLCSRIATASVQLRIYAGHEAWWPDALIARMDRRREERIKAMRERMNP